MDCWSIVWAYDVNDDDEEKMKNNNWIWVVVVILALIFIVPNFIKKEIGNTGQYSSLQDCNTYRDGVNLNCKGLCFKITDINSKCTTNLWDDDRIDSYTFLLDCDNSSLEWQCYYGNCPSGTVKCSDGSCKSDCGTTTNTTNFITKEYFGHPLWHILVVVVGLLMLLRVMKKK